MAEGRYVSRAGLKLEHALRAFDVDPSDMTCADFGCNVGGFTDCLLQHGAAKVYAIDTAYGELAWKLRQESRVVAMERTNALHALEKVSDTFSGCDLVVMDLGWTKQTKAIPAARRWLTLGGRIISLVKPHYEATDEEKARWMEGGALSDTGAQRVFERVVSDLAAAGVHVASSTESPIRGGKSSRKSECAGNREFLILIANG